MALAALVRERTGDSSSERALLLANMAAASLKLGEWDSAVNDCTAALSMSAAAADTRHKALYRRASAFVELGDVEGAARDLAALPPSDSAVARLGKRVDAASAQRAGGGGGSAGGGSASGSARTSRPRGSRWKVS
eukprot:3023853-Prymnesium_polylepis.1